MWFLKYLNRDEIILTFYCGKIHLFWKQEESRDWDNLSWL